MYVVKSADPLRGRAHGATQMTKVTASENNSFQSGNSQLLIKYREAVTLAYDLGEEIKEVYSIIPPKVITEHIWLHGTNPIVVGLTVN